MIVIVSIAPFRFGAGGHGCITRECNAHQKTNDDLPMSTFVALASRKDNNHCF
jgi:hypothetical protein